MKKLLCFLAAAILTFFSLSATLPAMATSSAKISFNDVAARKGESVEITLCLSDCPKIKSMAVVPLYDSEKLEYIDGEWLIDGALLTDWNHQEQNGVILYSTETDLNGNIAKFTFKITDNPSWEDIDFSCKVVIKNGTEPVDVETDNLKIKIICDHEWDSTVFTENPTCTQTGYTYKVCTVCHREEIISTIETVPHTPSEWIIDKESTVKEPGKKHKECTVCHITIAEEDIPLLGQCNHIWGDEIFEQKSTCSENGMLYKVCTICSEKHKLYDIEKSGHVEGDWITDREATPEEEGERHKECLNCGAVIERETIQKSERQGLPPVLIIIISASAGIGASLCVFLGCRFISVKRKKLRN